MDKRTSSMVADVALLDYIGRRGDVAIGMGPLGLAVDRATGAPDQEPR